MTSERIERRVLGALRFVDAPTGLTVTAPLTVAARGARLMRNRLGLYVLMEAPGLAEHTRAFRSPPAAPPIGSIPLTVEVSDPAGRYLARSATLRLPRDPDPAADARSLFTPVDVALFPAPSAPSSPSWAQIRVSVAGPDEAGLAGALIRVRRESDGALLASGLSDARGEGLVALPGLQLFAPGDGGGPVLANAVSATLQAFHDPLGGPAVDPDALAGRLGELSSSDPIALSLASGRSMWVRVVI